MKVQCVEVAEDGFNFINLFEVYEVMMDHGEAYSIVCSDKEVRAYRKKWFIVIDEGK